MRETDVDVQARQLLLQITTDRGARLGFATLEGGRCPIVRDGTIIHIADADSAAVRWAMNLYIKMRQRMARARW